MAPTSPPLKGAGDVPSETSAEMTKQIRRAAAARARAAKAAKRAQIQHAGVE